MWTGARRIIRSRFPPIDIFEDIADPADWPLLINAEMKTNPRLMESIGNLDLVPPERRVSGPGASLLMAPFTHVSTDRPSRFSGGTYGILYAGKTFDTALMETVYHHGRFMAATGEAPGWTSQFREVVLDIDASLHDVRGDTPGFETLRDKEDYTAPQEVGRALRQAGSDGIAFLSVRHEGGECVGLFWPDIAGNVRQGRHLDYHWDGERVDLYRDPNSREVWRLVA
ncbi:MAG: RES family NAD+ phosphorylase [Devosia sp.]